MKHLVGEQRGRWTVVGEGEVRQIGKYPIRFVLARCACGTERVVRWNTLISATNGSRSCGCLKAEKLVARFSEGRKARFWAKYEERPNGCWEWQFATNQWGYGIVGYKRRSMLAHRLAWELTNGPVPDGKQVCHTCDNRKCGNPAHLWLGTNADNAEDMRLKGRARAPRGETNANAKLSMSQAREIRRRYAAGGISQQALADEFAVTQRVVSLVVRNESYKET